ncbi:MAG: C4-dicarboxylate ABC transporter [Candidatus Thermoplasmatota archaeon]|nr:C4-dicarboxylate ABC transporter [Candidatus Thermoplasmatota archaeon]
MRKSTLNLFGSEWFGIAISTLALAQVYILAFGETGSIAFRYVAEAFSILGISIFVVIFSIWVYRGFALKDHVFSHWNNLTRMSFTALIPIIGFVGNYQLIYFFGLSGTTAALSAVDFYANYILALALGVLLGYRLYTKEINPREMNYAIVIPPLAIGTSVFLAGSLMKFYGGVEAQVIYFLVLMGLGIFFFLFIFIGSLALAGHVSTKVHETLPTTMLPVGISSLIIINLLSLASFGKIDQLFIGLSSVEWLSVLLWGFEVWNFLVVMILILTHPARGTLGVWAYGFPLGLFATSTIKILGVTHLYALLWAYVTIAVILNILWVYAWLNTGMFLKNMFSREIAEKRAVPVRKSGNNN